MPNARVGAMPQPNNHQNNYPPGRGTWRNRTQQGGGLSIEDLKRQTAIRLAQEGGENSDADPSYQRYHQQQHHQVRHNPHHGHYQSSSIPHYGNMPPNGNQYYQQQEYTQHHSTTYSSQHYSSQHQHASRNYTDSQLGLGGRGGAPGGGGQPQQQQYPPMKSPSRQQNQQQYGTPRVPNHELALKDRGSAENSEPSEGGYVVSKGSYGNKQSSTHHRSDDRNVKQFKARGVQSPDGRRTPVRDGNVHGQKIIFSPSQRDHASTPTSVYSEPPRNRSNPNSPHNIQRTDGRSHNHRRGYRQKGPPPGEYDYRRGKQQSKLPHGLTVQELKEMTRARLAADAEAAEVSSVHSGGTHGSSNGSMYANVIPSQSSEPLTRNLVQTNDSIRHTQSFGANPVQHQYQQHPQQHQYQQYPSNVRHPSPVFGAQAPNQFNGVMQSPRQSGAMSDYQVSDSNSSSGGSNIGSIPFSPPPMSWTGDEAGQMANRSRCHSAEATTHLNVGSYSHVPMDSDVNRRRCLTMSPMALRTRMDSVNEETPSWFTDDDKDRLGIPQLSLRPSLHSTESAFSDSAFQPIGKTASGGLPFSTQKPQTLSHADRMLSMESQGHGDLPSSMAEAVLNSLTGAPPGIGAIGGDVIGSSPFRSLKSQSDNLLSASASGSESMFSNNGESNLGLLETHSWCMDGDDDPSNTLSLSHDFSSLLNMGEPSSLAPLRGRANTDPHFRWK